MSTGAQTSDAQPSGLPDTRSGAERRVAPRVAVDRPVQIQILDSTTTFDSQPIAARLVDFSVSGVGARVPRPIAPGSEILVTLPATAAAPTTPLVYRVARCTPLGGGQFHVGASFVRKPVKA
jgi:hypothetical protein